MSLPPEVPQPVNRPNAQPTTDNQLAEIEREMSGFERGTLRWAKVAVLLSALAALFICLQWREMHTGGVDTHNLAVAAKTQAEKMGNMSDAADKIRQAAENMVAQDRRIADNAQKALDASNKQSKASLDASIAASRQDQRAWLSVGDYTYTITESDPVTSSVFVTDSGKTPATKVLCRITGTTKPKGYVLRDSDIVYPADMPTVNHGTIFPNQHFPLRAGGDPMEPGKQKIWFDNVKGGEWIQYFFGDVRYRDVFGKDHWTHFCTQFIPIGGTGTHAPSITKLMMTRHKKQIRTLPQNPAS